MTNMYSFYIGLVEMTSETTGRPKESQKIATITLDEEQLSSREFKVFQHVIDKLS